MVDKDALVEADTDDLVRELLARFDVCIVVGERCLEETKEHRRDEREYYYRGSSSACIGLAHRLIERILREQHE